MCLTLVCSWAVLCLGVRECRGDDISVEELAGRLDRTMHRIAALEGAIGPEDGSWLEERFPDGTRVWDEDGRAIRMDRETLLHWIRQAKETPEGRSHSWFIFGLFGPNSAAGARERKCRTGLDRTARHAGFRVTRHRSSVICAIATPLTGRKPFWRRCARSWNGWRLTWRA